MQRPAQPREDPMPEGESRSATFVVRVTWRPDRTSGVVERVRTGERERFDGLGEIGRVIARMLDDKGGAS